MGRYLADVQAAEESYLGLSFFMTQDYHFLLGIEHITVFDADGSVEEPFVVRLG